MSQYPQGPPNSVIPVVMMPTQPQQPGSHMPVLSPVGRPVLPSNVFPLPPQQHHHHNPMPGGSYNVPAPGARPRVQLSALQPQFVLQPPAMSQFMLNSPGGNNPGSIFSTSNSTGTSESVTPTSGMSRRDKKKMRRKFTMPPKVNTLIVYTADMRRVLFVPRDVMLPVDGHKLNPPDETGRPKSLFLCNEHSPGDSEPVLWACPRVHIPASSLSVCPQHDVHFNIVWQSLEDVIYERFPDTEGVVQVARPNTQQTVQEMPMRNCLKTKIVRKNGRLPSRCAHFTGKGVCHLGPDCLFLHEARIGVGTEEQEQPSTDHTQDLIASSAFRAWQDPQSNQRTDTT